MLIPPGDNRGTQLGGDLSAFTHISVLENISVFDGPRSARPGMYTDRQPATNGELTSLRSQTIERGYSWHDLTTVHYDDITITLRGLDAAPTPGCAVVMGMGTILIAIHRRDAIRSTF